MRKKLMALFFAMLMGVAGVACEGEGEVGEGENGGVEIEGEVDGGDGGEGGEGEGGEE